MIIYNVTLNVEDVVLDDWLQWMKEEHIPEVINSGFFTGARLKRIINAEGEHNTFAIAYTCISMKELHQYQLNCSVKLQEKHVSRYADKVVAFRTIMEVLKEF